jgi:Fe(3+) dicitrate transport protein
MINLNKVNPSMSKKPLAILITGILLSTSATAADDDNTPSIERMSVIGSKEDLIKSTGSVSLIGELELERFEYDDIGRILATVPGVNIRQEDGYGLRPNIGFRGVTAERSKKINIMEDGVLIGPAPYSAAAAYYFPNVTRMTAIEVTKGPSTIKYGPNTVAGALNLISRPVPESREGAVDISFGTDNYGKLHTYFGDTVGDFGFLIEGLHFKADGFKELDGGGDTGFDKSDLMAKFNYKLNGDDYTQLLELKLSYAEETSDETYLGLTDADFAENPYRRYASSQLDQMNWEHQQVQLTHHIEFSDFNATTRIYRNDFERDWFKVNEFLSSQGGFVPTLQQILRDPTSEQNLPYYQTLTGERDSTLREILVLSTNAREYYSQGVQIDFSWDVGLFGFEHEIEGGIRFHEDQIERNHIEDNFFVRSGNLQSTGEATRPASTNSENTQALSVYIQDTLQFQELSLTLGVRGESIDGSYQNRAPGREQDFQNKTNRIWLPSVSAYYELSEYSGVFGGVHSGFVPTSPVQTADIETEKSVNYELGYRHIDNGQKAEVIGFFTDFSNLKESCSVSAGCDTDLEFNAGDVDIYGVEATFSNTYKFNSQLSLPWSIAYTRTESEFKNTFYSEFNQWGFVNAGDGVPYLADDTLSLSLGLTANNWQVSMLVNYSGEMKESAQTVLTGDPRDSTLAGLQTEALINVDLSGSYELTSHSQLYAKIDNIFDTGEIASRRPFGARPTKPRQFQVGFKYRL